MEPRRKKMIANTIRVVVCILALWVVVRWVSLYDRITLIESGEIITGTIVSVGDVSAGDEITFELADGEKRIISPAEIAVRSDGTHEIEYGLFTAWRQSNKNYLLLSLLIFMPVPVLQGMRLMVMLRAQDIHIGLWDNIKLAFGCNFLNFALPVGSTAGDVAKAYYVSLHTEHKTEAVTSIFLDRVFGLLGLVLIVAVVAVLAPSGSTLARFRFLSLGFLAVAAVGSFAYLSPVLRSWFIPYSKLERIPKIDYLRRIDRTARTLASRKMTCFLALLLTLALQGVAICSYFTVAVGLGLDSGAHNFYQYYAYLATGCVIQAIPVSPQGLGTVEVAYLIFFKGMGSPSQIVCMALGIRLVVLAASLPGALVVMTGSYRPRETENQDQVLTAEHPKPQADEVHE